jgi:hypothetical protein
MKYYNIHGIVKVASNVGGFLPKHFESEPLKRVDIEILQGDFEFDNRRHKKIGSFWGGKNNVYFESSFYGRPVYKIMISNMKGKTKLRFTNMSKIFNVSKLVMMLLEIKLLQKGCSLVHAGGVSKGGRGVVLFGWPGVGKSSTIFGLSRERNFEVFGDDIIIVSKNGRLYSFPTKAGVFYRSENVGELKLPLVKRLELFLRYLIARVPPFNRYVDAKMMVDLSSIVNVGGSSNIDTVYFLEPGHGKTKLSRSVALNRMIASTLQALFDHYLSNKMFYAYCYINGFDAGYIEKGMREILKTMIRDCFVIRSEKKDFYKYLK